MHILFVCSRNRCRSLTAERIFDGVAGHSARSVGTEPVARIRVTAGHLGWAELIVTMEKRHTRRLQEKFAAALAGKQIVCLHIPDSYAYMDEGLIARLRSEMDAYLRSAPA